MAYYRAGWKDKKLIRATEFWKGINGNCVDVAILDWCKLFADSKDKHHWSNIVTDKSRFETELLKAVGSGIDMHGFNQYVKSVRTYRDKFVAHLDNELVARIPLLEDSLSAVKVYHRHVVEHEAGQGMLAGLPHDIGRYYQKCLSEAQAEYGEGRT